MNALPRLDRSIAGLGPRRPVSILQIGGGNFLRGFFDWMIDVAHEKGLTEAGIAIAQTVGHDLAARLAEQDMLYTVLVRGTEHGRTVDQRRVVGSVSDAFDTASHWSRALAYAADPGLEIIVSNTTESGIVERCEPQPGLAAPASFPAKLTALLQARFEALGGAPGTGLLVVPCELIEHNGRTLKRIVTSHARRWGLGEAFLDWLERDNHFAGTLVDRIVPGHPSRDIERLEAQWGYRDPLALVAEPFHLLVIEAKASLERRLPLRQAGLGVIWTDDLEPYRVRKVRILNGAHTATALAGFLAGLDTVRSMIDDAQFAALLRRVLDREIVPFVPLPEAERRSYAQSVLERFANPHIRHDLLSITLNSTAKWKVRILPSIRDALAERGVIPEGLAFSLACLLRFTRGQMIDGVMTGAREAGLYPIRDDSEALAAINASWRRHDNAEAIVRELLGDTRIWGEDLNALGDLAGRTALHLARIEQDGVRAALAGGLAE